MAHRGTHVGRLGVHVGASMTHGVGHLGLVETHGWAVVTHGCVTILAWVLANLRGAGTTHHIRLPVVRAIKVVHEVASHPRHVGSWIGHHHTAGSRSELRAGSLAVVDLLPRGP